MAKDFRTVIEPIKSAFRLNHETKMTLIGSCFTDNIGSRLVDDGFDACVNPLGILFNPASIANIVKRALDDEYFKISDLQCVNGVYHCLDLESRRQSTDAERLLAELNEALRDFAVVLRHSDIWFVTFGTAWVFEYRETSRIVGNCHKLAADKFDRRRLSIEEIVEAWKPLCEDRQVVFTVSPVRHLADGLHGNTLSKSTLLLAIDMLVSETTATYFPAYEIVNDDLRDYRFYDADMKHPSPVACDYIYDKFAHTYFDKTTMALAENNRRLARLSKHRPIL